MVSLTFRILSVNQVRAALMLYTQYMASHNAKIPSTFSGQKGERFFETRSRARGSGVSTWPILLKAA